MQFIFGKGKQDRQLQAVRVGYTITSGDITAKFVAVQVTWPKPFANDSYTVTWSIEDEADPGVSRPDLFPQDMHNLDANGFDAVVGLPGNGVINAGDHVSIHAIAIADGESGT